MPPKNYGCNPYKMWFEDGDPGPLAKTIREIKESKLDDILTRIDGWEINQSVGTIPEIKMTIKATDLAGLDVKAEIQPYKYADLDDIHRSILVDADMKRCMCVYTYCNKDTDIKIKVEREMKPGFDWWCQVSLDVLAEIARLYDKAVEEKKEKEKNMNTTRIPPVVDMKSFNNKVVVVYFADGTHTKAVCSDNDIFDLDTGIMCCLFKRALDRNNGTKVLNKLIRSVHDVVEKKEAVKKAALDLKKARRDAQAAAHARNVEAEAKANAEMVDIVAAGVKKALEGHLTAEKSLNREEEQ